MSNKLFALNREAGKPKITAIEYSTLYVTQCILSEQNKNIKQRECFGNTNKQNGTTKLKPVYMTDECVIKRTIKKFCIIHDECLIIL